MEEADKVRYFCDALIEQDRLMLHTAQVKKVILVLLGLQDNLNVID